VADDRGRTGVSEWAIHRAELAEGFSVAYVREGVGGYPLVLLHGYPDTKRIWWRNIGPLADAGFEVIVPDLRGVGDSDLAPDGFYDPPAHGRDVFRLVHDVLGHQRCGAAAGDLGGAVLQDLGLRFEGFVERQVIFNGPAPLLGDAYRAAGIPDDPPRHERPAADYYLRQGTDPEGLAAELDTAERRRAYVADFYGHRLWAAPGAFDKDDVDFMTEPFGDAERLRASWGAYEHACGTKPMSEKPRFFETNPIPTLVLYGPADAVVYDTFCDRCAVAFPNCIGPFVVPGAGHFVQWERAGLFNRALTYLFADRLAGAEHGSADPGRRPSGSR